MIPVCGWSPGSLTGQRIHFGGAPSPRGVLPSTSGGPNGAGTLIMEGTYANTCQIGEGSPPSDKYVQDKYMKDTYMQDTYMQQEERKGYALASSSKVRLLDAN